MKRLSSILCLLVASLILTGCAPSTSPSRPPIPANLAAPCLTIQALQSESWDELAQAYIELAIQYGICAERHGALVQAWE